MVTISIKKILLAGTALVAVSTFSLQSQAANVPQTATATLTWASNGAHDNSTTDGTKALAGDDLNIVTFATTVTNNGTANDNSGSTNAFAIGALTNTGAIAGGPFTVTTGSANDLAVTIGSVGLAASTSQGSFTVNNSGSGNVNATTVNVTGAFSSTGNLVLTNSDTTTAKTVTTTVGGNYTSAGTSTITAGSFAGANSVLTLNGGTNTFGTALTLTDTAGGTGGHATLVLGGTGAQTVAGTIAGGAANEGVLTVTNTDAAGGVTFAGAIGGGGDNLYAINAGVANTTTTFSSAVHATTTNITSTGTVAFGSGSNTTNISFAGNDGIVTLATGGVFTGTIDDSTTANMGTLTLSGATEVTGTVGATDALKVVNTSGGTDLFDSAVKAQTIKIAGTGVTTFNGAVTGALAFTSTGTAILNQGLTGAVDFANNAGVVEVASGKTVSGTIDSASGGTNGTLDLLGSSAIASTVGATNPLLLVDAGANGSTSSFAAALRATTFDVTGTGAVIFNAATTTNLSFVGNGTATLGAGQTLTGNVDTPTTAGTGNFDFAGNGTVTGTLGATHALNTLSVGAANTTGFTGTVNGNLVAANTTSVGGNTLATNGTFNLGAGQTLNATITGLGATANGKVTSVGTATISNSAILDITVSAATTTAATTGTTYNYNFVTSGGVAVGQSVIIHGASPLWTFTQVSNTADLEIAAHRDNIASIASLGGSPNEASVGAALDIASGGSNAALTTPLANLAAAPTAAAANNILASLTPTVNGGAQMAALDVRSQVQGIADTRMAALRADDGTTGVASGTTVNGVSAWLQGYGQTAQQDVRDSVAGYSAKTGGGAIGMDTQNITDNGVVGLALNFGRAFVDSKDINTTSTDINNYGFTLYSTAGLGLQTFLDSQLGYAFNKIDNIRHNVGGAGGPNADGKTHSHQFDGKLSLGHDFTMGETTLTPDVSAAYTYLTTAGYTETGSGANLSVASNNQSNLDFGLGIKAAWNIKDANGSLMKPMVHAGYQYAAVDDKIDTTSTFVGSPGAPFATIGPIPERSTFNVGAGLTYMTTSNWDMSANYNYEYRTGYQSHAGTLRMTSHF